MPRRRSAPTRARESGARGARLPLGAGERIRQDLDPPRRRQRVVEDEVAPSRHLAALAARPADPFRDLAPAADHAPGAETPDLTGAGRRVEAHLRERDAEFGHPALLVGRRSHFPDRIEADVDPVVIVVVVVGLQAGWVGREQIAGLVIVTGVELDRHRIGRRAVVAAGESACDPIGRPIETADRDVDELIVVRDLDQRAFARRLVVVRIPLHVLAGALGAAPHFVVEGAIDSGGGVAGDPEGVQDLARLRGNHRFIRAKDDVRDAAGGGILSVRAGRACEADGQGEQTEGTGADHSSVR